MKITGFTIVRNAQKYDYPVVESIQSVLPLCDEFVVLVGNSDDDTLKIIQSIDSPKIKIFESIWDDSLREGGKVLAVETNKAMQHISTDSTWAFYIQADELLHEQDYEAIRLAMRQHQHDEQVEGLLFRYIHFYGSPDYVADSRRWYRQEIRVFKPSLAIQSYRDAQGFRKSNRKLQVKWVDACIYHYGWLKSPQKMTEKLQGVGKFWYSDEALKQKFIEEAFDYSTIDSLRHFSGTHPAIMQKRIAQQKFDFKFDVKMKKYSFRFRVLHFIENLTGYRIGEYKNFKLLT